MDIDDRVFDIFEEVQYVVVTRGRVDPKLQMTLKNIPHILRQYVLVATAPDEVDDLRQLLSDLNLEVDAVIGFEHNFLGQLRQQVVDGFKQNIVFIDDMFTFHAREHSDTGVETKYMLKQLSEKNFTEERREEIMVDMFEWVTCKILTGKFGMVGISNRPSNNNILWDEVYNDRIGGFWGINYEIYSNMDNPPQMDTVITKEDMHLELSMLIEGIPVVKSSTYAFNRSGGANSNGGCSLYRNVDLMEHDALQLKELFPDYVHIKDKPAKSWGNVGDRETFKDVTIQWKKAYSGPPVHEVCGYKPKEGRTKQNYPRK